MTATALKDTLGPLWPYLVVIVIGFLPTDLWRILAVWAAKDLKTESDILLWVRLVATTLLAAVVAKIVLAPTGALQIIPLWHRVSALAIAIAVLLLFRRSVVAAVLTGAAVVILSGWQVS